MLLSIKITRFYFLQIAVILSHSSFNHVNYGVMGKARVESLCSVRPYHDSLKSMMNFIVYCYSSRLPTSNVTFTDNTGKFSMNADSELYRIIITEKSDLDRDVVIPRGKYSHQYHFFMHIFISY